MTFDLQPTLTGELLTLRPLRPDDWVPLFAVASDPLIWEQHPDSNRWKEDVFREFFHGALESGGALVAVDRKDGRIVGSSRFHGWDEAAGEVEIGWTFLARSHWGGRYNGEMKRLMLGHAFRFVTSVIFVVGLRNLRSQRAIERVGGVLEGPRLVRGRESLVYRISRPSGRPSAPRAAQPTSIDVAAWYERIPPAVWFFACLGGGWGLDRAVPFPIPFPTPGWQLGPAILLFALAGGVATWSIRLFRLRRTTVLPFGVATALLTTGPYRFSRNPLYVALVAMLAGFGLLLATAWVLVGAAALLLVLDRLVIRGEEAVLARVFGAEYEAYTRRVRRWL